MGDLHSIAYTYNNNFNIVSAASSSILDSCWNFEMNNVGNFETPMSHNSHMENTPPPCLDSFEHDHYSSGYLQDALFELGDRTKRRRLILFAGSDQISSIQGYLPDSSDSSNTENSIGQTSVNSGSFPGLNDDNIGIDVTKSSVDHNSPPFSSPDNLLLERFNDVYNSSVEKTVISNSFSLENLPTCNISLGLGGAKFEGAKKLLKKRSQEKMTRVAYPFAMVKPPGGGTEGAFTLNDINERILMPPTRPLRHPVGDYACRPILSPRGPGLSGKTVVAFTRIQTQGRGTITIIRTKG